MSNTETTLTVDLRKVTQESFAVHVQYKGRGWLKIGLWFIKIGCWIGGFNLVDEFPLSLLQPNGEPYKNKRKQNQ